MLVDTQYSRRTETLLVSYINPVGEFKIKYLPWKQPYKYEVCSEDDPDKEPEYTSWQRKPIKKAYGINPDRYSTYEFLDAQPEDVRKEIFDYALPTVYFIDIETEVIDGFPNALIANEAITAISIVYDDKIVLLGYKDLEVVDQKEIEEYTNKYFEKFGVKYQLKYIKFEDEFDMLHTFFEKMLKKMACVTGWNFLDFDMNFLINRAKRITKTKNGLLHKINPASGSYINRLQDIWMTKYTVPAHKLVFDYMQLYEALDTSVKIKESSSLDFVSNAILGVKKIEYQESSLNELYEKDFKKFMLYNTVDSVLVQQIHLKTNFLSIIFGIASLAQIKTVDVYSQINNALGSLAITEGVLRKGFREQEKIILFKDKTAVNDGSTITGGYVFDPVVGMNLWVSCYDFASLYPTTQRQFFIAPENYVGILDTSDSTQCINMDGRAIPITEDMVICVNGSVFYKRYSPTIQMLDNVYKDRKYNKGIMNENKFNKEDLLEEKKLLLGELELVSI